MRFSGSASVVQSGYLQPHALNGMVLPHRLEVRRQTRGDAWGRVAGGAEQASSDCG